MKPEAVKCPTCSGPMVSRVQKATGRRFWGCARFPDCKGTLNTDGEPGRRFDLAERDIDSIAAETPSERQRRNDGRRWEGGE